MRRIFSMYRGLGVVGMAALSIAGLGPMGCGSGGGGPTAVGPARALGTPAGDEVPTVCTGCLSEDKVGETLAVEGEIVQQCPASGCWFRMEDAAGEVFVDLAPAGLRLERDRVGQQAKVQGRLAKTGGSLRLEARHVEFAADREDAARRQEQE